MEDIRVNEMARGVVFSEIATPAEGTIAVGWSCATTRVGPMVAAPRRSPVPPAMSWTRPTGSSFQRLPVNDRDIGVLTAAGRLQDPHEEQPMPAEISARESAREAVGGDRRISDRTFLPTPGARSGSASRKTRS